jgi:hypothetical protein
MPNELSGSGRMTVQLKITESEPIMREAMPKVSLRQGLTVRC